LAIILNIIEKAHASGAAGAKVTELIQVSGLEPNDALYIIRALISDGSLARLNGGRIVSGLPLSP